MARFLRLEVIKKALSGWVSPEYFAGECPLCHISSFIDRILKVGRHKSSLIEVLEHLET